MKRFREIAFVLCLMSLVTTFAPEMLGQQNTPAPAAKNKSESRTGQLLKIEKVYDLEDQTEKASYLLTIQAGSDQYVARYRLTYFNHDRSNELAAGKDVEYRIAGGKLFVKTPNGKEIKAGLCKRIGNCDRCGKAAYCS